MQSCPNGSRWSLTNKRTPALGGNPDYFFDELHLNPAGQAHFAAFLTDELQRIL